MMAGGHCHYSVYNRLLPWDHAAGVLLHAEAGGYAARLDGSAYRADETEGGLICAGPGGVGGVAGGFVCGGGGMLELRPNCECCDRDLAPGSLEAMMCSFECTFCAGCAGGRFRGICPNCGGELVRRPVRPEGKLVGFPGSTERRVRAHPECAPG